LNVIKNEQVHQIEESKRNKRRRIFFQRVNCKLLILVRTRALHYILSKY